MIGVFTPPLAIDVVDDNPLIKEWHDPDLLINYDRSPLDYYDVSFSSTSNYRFFHDYLLWDDAFYLNYNYYLLLLYEIILLDKSCLRFNIFMLNLAWNSFMLVLYFMNFFIYILWIIYCINFNLWYLFFIVSFFYFDNISIILI